MNTQRVEGHTPTLKPCPFCGSPAEDEVDYGEEPNFYIHCSNKDCCIWDCGMSLESWNTRPFIERLEKVNEALVRYAEQVRDCKYVPDYVHEWSEAVLRLAKEPA